MNVTFNISDEAYDQLKKIAEARGIMVHALSLRFVEQGLGRTCLPCAGMGTDDEARMCPSCRGTGLNPKASQLERRQVETIAREFVCGELFTMLPLFGPKEVDIDRIIKALADRFSRESS